MSKTSTFVNHIVVHKSDWSTLTFKHTSPIT